MMRARGFVAAAAAGAAVLLTGCGDQGVVVFKQGEYQGKPDTAPWNNAAPQGNPQVTPWQQGDRASWEQSIKTRNQGQNEYVRLKNK
jgi:hypothetical protein